MRDGCSLAAYWLWKSGMGAYMIVGNSEMNMPMHGMCTLRILIEWWIGRYVAWLLCLALEQKSRSQRFEHASWTMAAK